MIEALQRLYGTSLVLKTCFTVRCSLGILREILAFSISNITLDLNGPFTFLFIDYNTRVGPIPRKMSSKSNDRLAFVECL